jgi:hypothetical protein
MNQSVHHAKPASKESRWVIYLFFFFFDSEACGRDAGLGLTMRLGCILPHANFYIRPGKVISSGGSYISESVSVASAHY